MYDKNSAAESSTLYAAKKILNARNVPITPMDDVDASFEFFEQYTEALLLAAVQQVIETKNIVVFDEDKGLMELILNEIVEKFVSPGLQWDFEENLNFYECGSCGKRYKKLNTLRKHVQEKHGGPQASNEDDGKQCPVCGKIYVKAANLKKHIREKHKFQNYREEGHPSNTKEDDNMHRYSIVALVLGLLVMDYNNAEKVADGEGLLKLYKLIMLLYKIDGRTKYSYYTYQMLCQVYYLLPDFMSHNL